MNPPIQNKLARVLRIDPSLKCVRAHKYLRFSKKNKTYKTDRYFCADCGHNKKFSEMFGILTRCWNCEREFSFNFTGSKLMLKPVCNDCREEKKEVKTEDKQSIIYDILSEIIER